MEQNQLKELYVSELRDIYNAENQLIKALPENGQGLHFRRLAGGLRQRGA
jgi:ferritin-like metal-binding protein YciE